MISRYHRFRQDDGMGFGILKLDVDDPTKGIVVAANLSEEAAAEQLSDLRRTESKTKSQA